MNTSRRNARIVGVLFLTAMVSSLMGGGIIESVLNTSEYLIALQDNTTLFSIGVVLELINSIAVIGIALLLYPILKEYNQSISVGYVGLRITESVFCFVGAILPLFLAAISQEIVGVEASETAIFQTQAKTFIATRAHVAGTWIPLFFSLGALLFYALLFQTKLLPRFISVWGFFGAVLILFSTFMDTGLGVGMVLALPMILNEIFLGIWLIIKGFNIKM